MKKSELISLRLKTEDLEFLSKLNDSYGKTTSEKIRNLIREAKKKNHDVQNMASIVDYNTKQFENIKTLLSSSMIENGLKSEVLDLFHDWIVSATSIYQSLEFEDKLKSKKSLEQAEKKITDEVFYLIDRVFLVSLGQQSRVINNLYFLDNIKTLIELSKIVESTTKKGT